MRFEWYHIEQNIYFWRNFSCIKVHSSKFLIVGELIVGTRYGFYFEWK